MAERTFESKRELGIGDFVGPLSSMCMKMHRTVELGENSLFGLLFSLDITQLSDLFYCVIIDDNFINVSNE